MRIINGIRVDQLYGFDELDEVSHFLRELHALRRTFLWWDQGAEGVQMLQGRGRNRGFRMREH